METQPGEMFLGGLVDPESRERTDETLAYPSERFTTHGVIVGMTGSGKTGLGIDLVEEALLAQIPTLVLDPKGDMGNLLLQFPEFEPGDFAPYVDEAEARRQGITVDELAARTAARWREGLASWGIGADRLRRLLATADLTIYTPGSSAGVGLDILGSLAAPADGWDTDPETFRDEIEGYVSSLLTLAGIDADPISDPEHILVATIIEDAWRKGRDLDLASLITAIPTPPFRKLGVFDLDEFFPSQKRMALAMKLNGLVASPSFAEWMQGTPLDVDAMLRTADGSPRAAIVYLAHLSDTERQFVVTLLLSKLVTWMRRQAGTSELRALVYMDEVFGFVPPTAEPPSKKPILTILKQARAYGVGMVLSTQNPVDLDYKAMSNAGTWMIGRLQTERDKARILEGLSAATGAVDVDLFDRLISGLDKRQFVLHSTRESQPMVFTTRWAQSYLAGPLTRDQIATLMADRRVPTVDRPVPTAAPASTVQTPDTPPEVASGIQTGFADPAAPWLGTVGADPSGTVFEAAALATVRLRYDDAATKLDHREDWEAVIFPLTDPFDPENVYEVDHDPRDVRPAPPGEARFRVPDAPIGTKSFWTRLARDLRAHLVDRRTVTVYRNRELKLVSRVGETEDAFRARCRSAAEDRADADVAKLVDRYRRRIDAVKDKLRTAERRVRDLTVEVEARRSEELLSGAGDLLGAILGGRRRSSALSRAAARRRQTRQLEQRLASAQERQQDLTADLAELEDELADEIEAIGARWQDAADQVEELTVPLEASDVRVEPPVLVWIPADGS